MKKLLLLTIILLFLAYLDIYSIVLTGKCFVDLNNDKSYNNNEPGLGALVSNGRDVVKCKHNGIFNINVEEGDVVFVIKPNGYKFHQTELGNNYFYYVYSNSGSPVKEYEGYSKNGKQVDTIYFPLIKDDFEKENFKVALLGDSQVSSETEINYFANSSLIHVMNQNPDFGIMLGDIVYDKLTLIPKLVNSISKTGLNWYYLPGNHDINFDAINRENTDDSWNKYLGPSYYSFNYGNVHFLVLFNIHYDGNKKYHAELGDNQLQFIKNDLSHVPKDKLIAICMHIPVEQIKDKEKLFDLLENRDYTVSFSGHTHTNQQLFIDKRLGWKNSSSTHHHIICGATCGSWWDGVYDIFGVPQSMMGDGSPKGYWIADFYNNSYKLTFNSLDKYSNSNLSIWTYSNDERDSTMNIHFANRKDSIYVNVFGGSSKTIVKANIDNGHWFELTPVVTIDPYYERIIQFQKNSHWKDFRIMPYWYKDKNDSYHLWGFRIPSDLKKGVHIINVEATDECGIYEKGQRIFNIE